MLSDSRSSLACYFSHLLKKSSVFNRSRRFIAVLTTACQWELASPRWMYSTVKYCSFETDLSVVLQITPRAFKGFLPLSFPTKILHEFITSSMRITRHCPFHPLWSDGPNTHCSARGTNHEIPPPFHPKVMVLVRFRTKVQPTLFPSPFVWSVCPIFGVTCTSNNS